MRVITRIALCSLAIMFLVTTTGCPEPRTTNQGGGNILSAGSKLAANNVGDLTADEWQILVDAAPQFAGMMGIVLPEGETLPQLTDDQAAAIVALLDERGITSVDELRAALENGTITEDDIPEGLEELFS